MTEPTTAAAPIELATMLGEARIFELAGGGLAVQIRPAGAEEWTLVPVPPQLEAFLPALGVANPRDLFSALGG